MAPSLPQASAQSETIAYMQAAFIAETNVYMRDAFIAGQVLLLPMQASMFPWAGG